MWQVCALLGCALLQNRLAALEKTPFSEAKASLDVEHFSLASLQDSELLHGSNEGQCCRNHLGCTKLCTKPPTSSSINPPL